MRVGVGTPTVGVGGVVGASVGMGVDISAVGVSVCTGVGISAVGVGSGTSVDVGIGIAAVGVSVAGASVGIGVGTSAVGIGFAGIIVGVAGAPTGSLLQAATAICKTTTMHKSAANADLRRATSLML